MEEIKLYYTPKITDIRVGYKLQSNNGSEITPEGVIKEDWEDCIVSNEDSLANINASIIENLVRTKYITIEDIVALGWEDEGQVVPQEGVISDKPINLRRFNKGRYLMIYDFIAKVVMIAMTWGDQFSVAVQRYDCPSVNELIYILSALNLNHI